MCSFLYIKKVDLFVWSVSLFEECGVLSGDLCRCHMKPACLNRDSDAWKTHIGPSAMSSCRRDDGDFSCGNAFV